MAESNLYTTPGIPLDEEGPVFREPWEARAFALACTLQERGVFSRTEWAEELGKTIRAAQAAGDKDHGDTYYQHWLNCLEALTVAKGLTTQEALNGGKRAAHEAHQQLHASLGHFHHHHGDDQQPG